MALNTTTSIFYTVAGIGIFLTACTIISSSIRKLGGERLKPILSKADKSKLTGVGAGAAATALIQSSSAATVMVIGFVDAGIMTLNQAATVIYGANIGTTVTSLLVALGLSGSSVSISVVLSSLTCVGAFMSAFARRPKTKLYGNTVTGFGMLFVGLDLINGAMLCFSELPSVKAFIGLYRNPLLLIVVGMLMTAIIQSSSIMTSIAIASVVSGLISFDQAVYLTMGANVGTCITALLACIARSTNAKRAALIHLIFNIAGVILFMLSAVALRLAGTNFSEALALFTHATPQIGLAVFHTVFNTVTAAVMLPLTTPLVKSVVKLVPEKSIKRL